MPLIPKPTQLDIGLIAGAEAAHHLASTLLSQWNAFWNREPATVLAELNSDVQRSATIFALNGQAAAAVNALLDAIADDRFTTRAPSAMAGGFDFQSGEFTYTPPTPPETPVSPVSPPPPVLPNP